MAVAGAIRSGQLVVGSLRAAEVAESRLEGLPVDVLSRVSKCLASADLGRLSMTSRTMHACSLELADADMLGKLFCTAVTKRDRIAEIQAIMAHPKFSEIPATSMTELGETLHSCCMHGHSDYFLALIAKNTFVKTSVVDKIELSKDLYDAALAGHVAEVQKLMDIGDFFPTGTYNLAKSLSGASSAGHMDVVHAIMAHPKFAKLPATGPNSLGRLLRIVANKNCLPLVYAIIAHPRFAEIPATGCGGDSLAGVLSSASSAGHVDVVRAIIAHRRFAEIPATGEYSLTSAFHSVVADGILEGVTALLNHPRFVEISADDLLQSYKTARAKGHREIASAIYLRLKWKTQILINMRLL